MASKSTHGQKQSSVIRPGTGSGSRPTGGSTKTMDSAPMDKRGMGREPKGVRTLK